MKKINTIFLFSLVLLSCFTNITKAQQTYYYDFRNTLNENSGQGPVLNVLGTGAFVNEGLTELSCISRPVYGFTQNSGIQFDNTAAGNFITGTYSIEMYFQFLNNSGFKRILDYHNQGSDSGLYCTANQLWFYNALDIPTTAFTGNQYVHLVVTRDGATKDLIMYVDGVNIGSFVDTGDLGVLGSTNVLNFFQDDTISGGEARPGRIALLKIYNTVIDSAAVINNFNNLESTSATLVFESDVDTACLAGNVFNFTNTSQNAGGLTYTYDFGDGNTAPGPDASHSYLADGTYTVTLFADDGAGCIDSVTQDVLIYPQPVFSLSADSSICDGTTLDLDAGAGFSTYLWNDSTTNQTLTVGSSGTYSVIVTDANGCSATDSVDVTIILPPAVQLGNDTTLCFGSTITISAPTGEAAYLWSTGELTESIVVTAPGVYAVEVTNSFGCIGTDTIEVSFHAPLIISLGPDSAFCIGDTLILDAGPGFTSYLWNDGSSLQTYTATVTGSYSVNVVDSLGCSSTDTVDVLVNSLPVISLGADTSLCGGTSLTLDAGTGFVNYLWNDGTQTQTLSVAIGGTYSVLVTDVNGCAGIDSISVTLTPLVNLGPDLIVCQGLTVTLDAGPSMTTYLWNNGSSNQTLDVSVSGIYSVTVSDAGGCINSDEVLVTFNPLPVFDLGPDLTSCSANPPVLDAGAGFYAYLWNDGSTLQTLTATTSGTYFVTVSSAPGCTGQDSVTVTINPSPVVNLGADTTLCDGTVYTLDAGSGFNSYLWSDGSFNQTLDVTSSGTYSVTITGSNGCTGVDTVVLIFDPLPFVELGPDQNICNGTATVLDAGAGFAGYLWSDGSTNQLLLVSVSGTYAVTVSNPTGCSSIDSVTINVLNSPVISLGPDTTVCDGALLTLDAGSGFSNYLWNNGTSSQTLTVSTAGNYSVIVTDANGCNGTDDIEVSYYAPVPTPSITQLVNVLQSSPAAGYQWYSVPGGILTGATSQTYSPGQNGTFYVIVTDANGCQSAPSPDVIFVFDGIATVNGVSMVISPNPANSTLMIETKGVQNKNISLEMTDMLGKVIYTQEILANENFRMDVSEYPEGIYFVKISGTGFSSIQKIIISR